jgi:hypothetical protein
MKIETATESDIRFVASRMREADLREFCAVNDASDRWGLTELLVQSYGARRDLIVAMTDEENPVAVGGLIPVRPNVVSLLFFATDEFRAVARGLTRWIKAELFPRLMAEGVRIECWSQADHHVAHRWIEHLGLTRRYEDKGFGKAGETFVLFTWVKDAGAAGA